MSAEFDCPVVRQNCSLLATAHGCEAGLLLADCADSMRTEWCVYCGHCWGACFVRVCI